MAAARTAQPLAISSTCSILAAVVIRMRIAKVGIAVEGGGRVPANLVQIRDPTRATDWRRPLWSASLPATPGTQKDRNVTDFLDAASH